MGTQKGGSQPMTRAQILTALNDRLTTHYPPDVVDRIQSMISGTLAELDALPPYPRASARGFHNRGLTNPLAHRII